MNPTSRSKTVLITGCSSGFGRQMVEHFLKNGGWTVFATTRKPEVLASLQDPGLHILPWNVALAPERARIVQQVTAACARGLDCLVNNAGYGLTGPLESLSEDEVRNQFEVNFFAPLLLTRELLAPLRQAKGKLINVSSVLGFVGMPMQSIYVASKFAVEGMSECLYHELSAHGVQVALVEPGGYRTGFASNIRWAAAAGDSGNAGAYRDQLDAYRRFWLRLTQRPNKKNPSEVADLIVKLANKQRLPLRTRVGSDCNALYYLRRSLPQRIADGVLSKICSSMTRSQI